MTLKIARSGRLIIDVVRNKCGIPKTDGKCVCWSNGATLSLQEMFDMLQTGKKLNFPLLAFDSVFHFESS